LSAVRRLSMLLCALLAFAAQPAQPMDEGPLPGTIGVVVKREAAGLMVIAVREGGPARRAGLRVGDIVLRYNGAPVADVRQFNRLVAESPPGEVARIELMRDGAVRTVEVIVRQLSTARRG
jgi:S1-C subfamily serine protease